MWDLIKIRLVGKQKTAQRNDRFNRSQSDYTFCTSCENVIVYIQV